MHARYSREIASNSTIEATLPTPTNHTQQSSASNQNELIELNNRRAKRQSTGREQLCQTTYQYITPQAALNSQGKILKYQINPKKEESFQVLLEK